MHSLGYSLLQERQLIAYGVWGRTSAEQNYVQIEKEMLVIVVGGEKFDYYIYGHKTYAETDHKPFTKKLVRYAPKRLQRMLLHYQKYDIELIYKGV